MTRGSQTEAGRFSAANRQYATGLARGFGGAIIFAFPLLMTMEMWWLGAHLDRLRVLIFVALDLALLVGLSRFAGFEPTFSLKEDLLDGLAAFGLGFLAAALMLALLGMLTAQDSWDAILGKIALQAVPASIGAAVATKLLTEHQATPQQEEHERHASYAGQLFLMLAGAIFLAFNVAPTEEMKLIAFAMTPWRAIGLVLASLLALHAFVYAVGFAGQEGSHADRSFAGTFLHYTIAGYGIALLVSLYVLWTFGRTDGVSLSFAMTMTVVLGFPAALGAAIARLIV